jgi:hypothetical protein
LFGLVTEIKSILSAQILVLQVGFKPKEILQELNKIDVYIQTSLWEGLPIAVWQCKTSYHYCG